MRAIAARSVAALARPEPAVRLAADGTDAVGSSPQQFAAHLEAERGKRAEAIRRDRLAGAAGAVRAPQRVCIVLASSRRSTRLRTSARVSWSCAPRLIAAIASGSNSASSSSVIACTVARRGIRPP